MANFEKPLHEFTEEELQQRINQWDPRFGALALYELQRRLQKKNTEQITALVKEIKSLKSIVDKNAETTTQSARSSNRLAKTAIIVAVMTLIVQVLFSVHQELRCYSSAVYPEPPSNKLFNHYSDCQRHFDLGLFGKHSIKISDYKKLAYP